MTFKIKVRWGLVVGCICTFISLVLFGNSVSQKKVPIGVQVEIAELACKTWGGTEKKAVSLSVRGDFLKKVRKHFKHWDFLPQDEVHTTAILTLAITKKGLLDELFFQVRLDAGSPGSPGYESDVLAEMRWLDSADLLAALPDSSYTEKTIRQFLNCAFPQKEADRTVHVKSERLQEVVPLAWNPKWCNDREKAFVLPLSKTRHGELRWSVFELRSLQGDPEDTNSRNLAVKAKDQWGKYDNDPIEVLMAEIQDSADTRNPNNYKPSLVFLKRYVPDIDEKWGIN